MSADHKTAPRSRGPHVVSRTTGHPRPGGMLSNFIARQDSNTAPVTEDGLVYVSVEGMHPRKAVLDAMDFKRITSNNAGSPRLTRSRWWQDPDTGMLYAYSLRDRPMEQGVLVAAAILNADIGDTIEVSGDSLDLRLCKLKTISRGSHAAAQS